MKTKVLAILSPLLVLCLTGMALRQTPTLAQAAYDDTTHDHPHDEAAPPHTKGQADQEQAAGEADHAHAHGHGRSTTVTVWSDRFEIFMEYPFWVAGEPGEFVTHVTDITDFSPRRSGPVSFVLKQGTKRIEQREPTPKRAGIYIPTLVLPSPGTWALTLRIAQDGRDHVIELPPVQVYASQAHADKAPAPAASEGFSFLKEQQWNIPFLVQPVQAQVLDGTRYMMVPDTALVHAGGQFSVYVQVGGETYAQRRVQVHRRSQDMALIAEGLSQRDYVVTRGTGSLALAASVVADHDHAGVVQPTAAQIQQLGIQVEAAQAGGIDDWLAVPGEISINGERMAHITPRVGGVVSEVRVPLGEQVQAGQILAVIESPDLAGAKAEYLSAQQTLELARTSFQQEQTLFEQKVSSEREYLSAKRSFAEAQIQWRSARHKILTLGLSPSDVEALSAQPEAVFTRYNLCAPFDGTLIQKHLVLGEVVDNQTERLVIADLSTVWVDLMVNQKDVLAVSKGQKALISLGADLPEQAGTIDYVDPVLNQTSRTAIARLILDNADGRFHPGLFVKGRIQIKTSQHAVLVPTDSVQIVDDQPCVFRACTEGFEVLPVTLGSSNRNFTEILSGIQAGDRIVTKNAFHLKAEHQRKNEGSHAGHGHAH